jgi:thymidylate synthase
MKAYLDILKNVNECREWRKNRTGIPDIGLGAGAVFEHDMSKGFPLITTKKMGLKNIATELEFFLNGITDKKWLQDRKCKIWNEWARPSKIDAAVALKGDEGSRNMFADVERDLGAIYGFQWRHFGGGYQWSESRIEKDPTDNFDHSNPGVDQVKNIIDKLHNNPADRRMIVSAWNPVAIPDMALPPCHMMHQLIVRKNRISLVWYQRSCDMFLGVPYNIASYAMLLLLYAKESGFKPHILKGILADAHIYKNHVAQVEEQLTRAPHKLPKVEIPNENWNGMLNWKATDFVLKNYVSHEALKAQVAR